MQYSSEEYKKNQQRKYEDWIERHTLTNCDVDIYQRHMNELWRVKPTFHLLLALSPGDEEALVDTIESLVSQVYPFWGLTILAQREPFSDIFQTLENVEWLSVEDEPARYLNDITASSTLEWVGLLEAGDRLSPHALYSFAEHLNANTGLGVMYADEDCVLADGARVEPRFKPDFNLELLRSMPYTGAFSLVEREKLIAAGGYGDHAGLEVYELMFRLVEQHGDGVVGHVADVLFHRSAVNDERFDIGLRELSAQEIVQAHLQRSGLDASVVKGYMPLSHYVDYHWPTQPLVTIIIPTKDHFELIKGCVDGLLAKTTYANFEVLIVDNGTTEAQALSYLDEIGQSDARVTVLKYPKPYSFSAINNFAAAEAKGDYLLLLNNDTVIVQEDWLERMLAYGQRDDVGIVGVRLVFPDQTLQHAGVVLGLSGVFNHCNIGLPMGEPGYMGRALVAQEFSAVTAACLLVTKSVYDSVGGLDEQDFAVLFNDVDLCLKVREMGKKVIWTPFVTLIHYASVSLKQKKSEKEEQANREKHLQENLSFVRKWISTLARDPAYNKNLSFVESSYEIDEFIDAPWDERNKGSCGRVMALPFDSYGCGQYRVRLPLGRLSESCDIQLALAPNHDKPPLPGKFVVPTEVDLMRRQPDFLYLHNGLHDFHFTMLEHAREHVPAMRRIFGMDDLMDNAPVGHIFRKTAYKDMRRRIRKALSLSDRFVVSTQPLAEAYRDFIDDIRVIPNYLDTRLWTGLESQRCQGRKPRVGWAGALQHQDDLALIQQVVMALADEVEWVFFGMCPEECRPYVHEFHEGVPFSAYPRKLASLNLDLAIAPLLQHPYNEAKSNLKLLEYGILGLPVVCTDIYPYQNAPVARVPNMQAAWIRAIRERINDPDAAEKEGELLRRWVLEHWMLDDHLDEWRAVFQFD